MVDYCCGMDLTRKLSICTFVFAPLFACGGDGAGDDDGNPASDAAPGDSDATAADATASEQLPPMGLAALQAWLDSRAYGGWTCEPAPHAARSPSPHGVNRICSNDVLAAHGAGEYPVGAASVKELFDADENLIGHAVARHDASGGGESWYWFEQLDGRILADGLGDSGVALRVCVGCHAGAGSDAEHSGHDFVYTQVTN